MAKEYDVLLEQAETIRTEVEDDANSAERVGGMFKDIIEKSKDESGRKLAIKDLATSVGYSTETSLTQDAATRLVSEYNVSINHPTAGVDETNRYTLSEAIAKVPAELRNAGVKVSFLDESGSMETWEFQGESWAIGSFSQVGAGKLTELESDINSIKDVSTNISANIGEDFKNEIYKNIKAGQKIVIEIYSESDITYLQIDNKGDSSSTQKAFAGQIISEKKYEEIFVATENIEKLYAWTLGSNITKAGNVNIKIKGYIISEIEQIKEQMDNRLSSKSPFIYSNKINLTFGEPSGSNPTQVCSLTVEHDFLIATCSKSYLSPATKQFEIAPYSYGALYAIFDNNNNILRIDVGALAGNINNTTTLVQFDKEKEFAEPIVCWQSGIVSYKRDSYLDIKTKIDDNKAKIESIKAKIEGIQLNDNSLFLKGENFTKTLLSGVNIGDKIKVKLKSDENLSISLLAITPSRSDTINKYFWQSIQPNNTYETEFDVLVDGDIILWTTSGNITNGGSLNIQLEKIGLEERIENIENPKSEFLANILPPAIYTVCNDIDWQRNYSLKLYIDHLFADVNKRPNVKYSDGTTVKCFYSKYNSYGSYVNSSTPNKSLDISENIIQEVLTNGQTINIPHRSIRNKATSNKVVRLLCIGDSVTEGALANYGIPYANAPKQYWSWVKALFEMDYIKAGNQGYFFESLGNLLGTLKSGYTFNITGMNGIDKNGIKAFACGVGGSKTNDWVSPQLNNEEINPFYDIEAGKFSLRYWVEKYRTLTVNPNGTTTRCSTSNKGELAPEDTTQYNVCEPTHVLIQLGYNQLYNTEGGTRDNYLSQLNQMITTIKEEYPDVYVLLSLPDTAGTYYPELFPEYIGEGDDIYSLDFMTGTAKSAHDKMAYMNKDLMEIADEDNKIYYVPTYFASPLCYGASIREISEVCYLSNGKNKSFVQEGGLPYLHPNNAAHANWAYQIYSLIKYTLLVE